MKKEFGGLGIPNMRDLNICLLASWIRRYANDSDKTWRLLIDFKYKTSSPNILTCRDTSTKLVVPTSLHVEIQGHLVFGMVLCGLLK
jgi:hypothetical protein